MRKITCIFLVACCLWAPKASAFNGHRKGFLLGIGLGVGTTTNSWNFSAGDYTRKSTQTKTALMNEWKIGYGPGNMWEIYFTNEDAYYGYEYTRGIDALCITRLSKPSSPSLFFTIGIGVPYWGNYISWSISTHNFGLVGGIGYEFRRHLDLTAELLYGYKSYQDPQYYKESQRNISIRVTINALAY
jgi:hypothetical protein